MADLVLTGHEDEALFPLATTPAGPRVASGGNDCNVRLHALTSAWLQSGPCLRAMCTLQHAFVAMASQC